MKKLFCPLATFFLLIACSKTPPQQASPSTAKTLSGEEDSLFTKVQAALKNLTPSEKLLSIESSSYLESQDKRFTIVFYRSDLRASNIVFEQEFSNGRLISLASVSCAGTSCDCKVLMSISSTGAVSSSCSCGTCTKMIDQMSTANPFPWDSSKLTIATDTIN